MRKFLILAALLPTVLLGACGLTSTELTQQITDIQKQVQADANLVCGFIPTVATIAAFIPGVGAFASDAASIAASICSAVTAAPLPAAAARLRSLKGGGQAVTVGTVIVPGVGAVPVTGTFTR